MSFRRITCSLIISALLLVLALTVYAEDKQTTQTTEKWQFGGEVYLWGAALDLRPQRGDDIKITFSDLIDNLDFAFMGTLGARKGKWSLLADIIYLDLSDDTSGEVELLGIIPIKTSLDAKVKAWVVTAGGGYTVLETDKFSLDLLGGARYLSFNSTIKLRVGPLRPRIKPNVSSWDGIIGMRGKADLSNKWYLSYYLDGGTGDTDFTWQGKAGLNYKFNKVDAVLGYRYLDYNVNGKEIDDFDLNGPYAGVKFPF